MNVHDSRYVFQSLEFLTPFLVPAPATTANEPGMVAGAGVGAVKADDEISKSAFRALRDVSDVCRLLLVQSVEQFINLFLNVENISVMN